MDNNFHPIPSVGRALQSPLVEESEYRSLHLIDVENLLGGTDFHTECVADMREHYREIAAVGPVDHVVLATSHFCAAPAWFGWPEARRLVRSGENGADLALLDVVTNERAASRYSRIVVASGDGMFADACARLQQQGVSVTVVSRSDALSRPLALAVKDVRFVTPHHHPAPAVIARVA